MKKKALLVSILIFSVMILIVIMTIRMNNKKDKRTAILNNATEENTFIDLGTNEKIIKNTNDNIIENTSEIKNTNEEKVTETQKKKEVNNIKAENITNKKIDNNEIAVANEKQNQDQNTNHEETKTEVIEETKTEQTIDFSKYDRYEAGLNGGYKCFKKNTSETTKLKSLIDSAIREFGYVDVQITESSSIINTRSFTANKTNVENLVYNSEGFKICYYAETEYTVTADGIESEFQIRSYLKVIEK